MNLNRFKQLLEASLGNVKPLISEDLDYYICANSDCSIGQSSERFPVEMDCPVCNDPLAKVLVNYHKNLFRLHAEKNESESDFNTVEGRIESLDSFFNQPGNGEDYYKMRDINNHFQNGGTIENLPSDHNEGEMSLKYIYRKSYKSFTADEFSEIFSGLKKTKEDNY